VILGLEGTGAYLASKSPELKALNQNRKSLEFNQRAHLKAPS
jgi:phage FluMu protein Com